LGGSHGDRAHDAVAELLLHFERQVEVLQLQRLVDARDGVARELDVDDGADDLGDGAFGRVSHEDSSEERSLGSYSRSSADDFGELLGDRGLAGLVVNELDRKSTRLNSS